MFALPGQRYLHLRSGSEQQQRRGRAEHPLAAVQPLQARTVTFGSIDQVEIANRTTEQGAADLAFAIESKGIVRQQRPGGLAIDLQTHALAFEHGDDPLIPGETGKPARLGDIGNRQPPAEAVQAFTGIAGDFFGTAAAVLPRHAGVVFGA
ncbi:hypothetical protein D3C78_1083060 [compost metagenome]